MKRIVMDLYLMRPGEALSKEQAKVPTDAERPLSDAGRDAVARIARGLRAMEMRRARVLTSPLVRARQTAELVAKALGLSDCLDVCEALHPDCDPLTLVETLRRLQMDGTILAVGHQPYLGRLAARLVFGASPDGIPLPPAGVCWLELPEFPRSLNATLRSLWAPDSLA